MTMLAIAIVRRFVPRVRVIVKLVAYFPEYELPLGDAMSVRHTVSRTIHIKVSIFIHPCMYVYHNLHV